MKWLIVTDDDINGYGGVAHFSVLLTQQLSKRGHTVYLLSKNQIFDIHDGGSYQYRTADTRTKVGVELFQKINKLGVKECLIQYVPYSFSRLGIPYHLLFLFFYIKLSGISVTTFFHEVAIRRQNQPLKLRILGSLQLLLARMLSSISDKSFTSNSLYKNYLKEDDVVLQAVPANITAKSTVQFFKDANVTFILSYINRATDVLFLALNLLAERGYNIKMMLIGNSIQEHLDRAKYYQKYCKYKIEILGVCNEITLASYYIQADIYCQLELVDNLKQGGISSKSGALAAALYYGKSIIATAGDMTDNFLLESDAFFFVQAASPEDVSTQIEYAIINKDIAEKRSINARALYSKYFEWSVLVDKLLGNKE
jgi:glycosyltransferase involved in cell wall biosynthesis